jgi:hypothetical protein
LTTDDQLIKRAVGIAEIKATDPITFKRRGIRMMTDTKLKIKGLLVLIESLGELEAERFISLMMREPFDYTKWQRSLLTDKTVPEISSSAMRSRMEPDPSAIVPGLL